VLTVDLFNQSPSIKPVPRLVCLPVFGHGGGPVQQVCKANQKESCEGMASRTEIDVFGPQQLERLVQCSEDVPVVGGVELGGKEYVLARHAGGLDAFPDLLLVTWSTRYVH